MINDLNIKVPTIIKSLAVLLASIATLMFATACGGENSNTGCSGDFCVVTFERGVDASANILGVEVGLVDVQGQIVTLDVAGQRVSLPANGQTTAGAYTLSVQEVTDQQVKVEIALA